MAASSEFNEASHMPANVSCDPEDGHGHEQDYAQSIHQDTASHSPLRMYLLLFALSLHSVSLLLYFKMYLRYFQISNNNIITLQKLIFFVNFLNSNIIDFSRLKEKIKLE